MKGKLFILLLVALTAWGCSSEPEKKFVKSPVDTLVRDMTDVQNFTLLLYDMDADESSDVYKHKYRILEERNVDGRDTLVENITDWYEVAPDLFNQHIEDMGMEIVSKQDGVVEKKVAPPGYSQYVGNEKYGEFRTGSNGYSFWHFYGQYAFMSTMFSLATMPARYSYYNNYRTNYYPSGRSYYGPNSGGRNMYGTNSSYNQSRTNTRWATKPASVKSRVRSQVARSASSPSSRRSYDSRTRRSNSRYGGSSRRSGGGFGK
ncbi:MAG: hypothetical protein AAGI38_02155 [Bacteroidota bacterium]